MRHLFVFNPKSFVTLKDLKAFLLSVESCFSVGKRAEYKTYISRFPRDAIAAVDRYCRAAGGETVRVYAVGGDGILFDCLNGLIDYPNAELASVPYGNSNDFIRGFGEGKNPVFRNIKRLSSAPVKLTDVMQCNTNYAIVNLAIGLEAAAVISMISWVKKINNVKNLRNLVPLFYKLGAIQYIFSGEGLSQKYALCIDGENFTGDYVNINVGNVCGNGGTNTPEPYAVANDGRLNAILLRKTAPLKILSLISDYCAGHFEKHPRYLEHRTFTRLSAESPSPMYVNLDGECYYANKIDIKLIPGAVKVVVPAGEDYTDGTERCGLGRLI